MWQEKLARLARAHRADDEEEARRFRNVPDVERARMLASLWRLAFAALGDSRPPQEERPESALDWWKRLVDRERSRVAASAPRRPVAPHR